MKEIERKKTVDSDFWTDISNKIKKLIFIDKKIMIILNSLIFSPYLVMDSGRILWLRCDSYPRVWKIVGSSYL